MEIGTQYYFAGCNGKPAGYCQYTETIGELHCFVMEDGSSVALGQEDIHTIVPMDQFHQMTLDEIQAMSRAISSICSACCKPHDTGACMLLDNQVLCPDCLETRLAQEQVLEGFAPSHTPTPWTAKEEFNGWEIYSGDTKVAGDMNAGRDMGEADAQRIVECVNACEGIENPAEYIQSARDAIAEALRIRNERDEIVESLVDILARFKSCISGGNGELEDDRPAINRAESAIAKAKGGQS